MAFRDRDHIESFDWQKLRETLAKHAVTITSWNLDTSIPRRSALLHVQENIISLCPRFRSPDDKANPLCFPTAHLACQIPPVRRISACVYERGKHDAHDMAAIQDHLHNVVVSKENGSTIIAPTILSESIIV